MFAKLLKREWKASCRLLSIMSLAALGVAVLEAVVFRMLITGAEPDRSGMVSGTMVQMMLFLSLAIVAYVIGVQIFLIVRFYKNKFTDEGYLTFTLPVSCQQIFLSSMLNMAIWTVISGAVTALCIAVIIGGGTFGLVDERIWDFAWKGIISAFQSNAALFGGTYWPLLIVNGIVGLFSSPVLIMTAFTLGAVIAKKHKVMASLGMIYLISMVASIATTILMTFVGAATIGSSLDQAALALQAAYYSEVFLQIAMVIGGYLLSVWLMKNKLTLA